MRANARTSQGTYAAWRLCIERLKSARKGDGKTPPFRSCECSSRDRDVLKVRIGGKRLTIRADACAICRGSVYDYRTSVFGRVSDVVYGGARRPRSERRENGLKRRRR